MRKGPVRIDWTGPRAFHVHAGDSELRWTVELGPTPVTRLFTLIGSVLPDRAWRSPARLAVMSGVAGVALRAAGCG